MIEGLAACFAGLTDPRETSRCDHQLVDILAIAVCAVVACAESWEDIELYGRSKQAWLGTFLALPNGIPSHDTFRRVFMLIDPDAFEACFTRWAQSLADGIEREVVAVDGKTVRRSGSRRHERGPPGPPARLPGPGGKGSRTLERLARPGRRAGGGDDPQHHRDLQGRGRDPLLPDQLRRRSRRPGAGDPATLERGERTALGLGC